MKKSIRKSFDFVISGVTRLLKEEEDAASEIIDVEESPDSGDVCRALLSLPFTFYLFLLSELALPLFFLSLFLFSSVYLREKN